MSEVVALVSRDGNVIGSAPRARVRRENLLHSATAVLVRNSRGDIFLHRRSDAKDWAPGFHDCAAGGVIQYGEQPHDSAVRELEEELGISGVPLVALGTSLYEDESTRCFEHCYEATWDGEVSYPDDEVVWGDWVSLRHLGELLREPGFRFVPDTRQVLDRLAEAGIRDYADLSG